MSLHLIVLYIYIYIYIYIYVVDFGKSDKMIKINGKVDKPTLTTDSIIFRFLFNLFWGSSLFNKEQNIIESIVSVGLSTFPLIFIIYILDKQKW